VLNKAIKKGILVGIISINWSKDLIKTFLNSSNYSSNLKDILIFCNDLEFDENDVSTGTIQGDLHTPFKKREYFKKIKENIDHNKEFSVYIGDSITDILAMLDVYNF